VADIFVGYTSRDRDWAFWIGRQLEKLGHTPHIHEWEIQAGGDIPAWMGERLQKADRVLCVVSTVYLTKDYSGWEQRSAQWAAADKRPNFMLPVFVEDCDPPVAMAHIKAALARVSQSCGGRHSPPAPAIGVTCRPLNSVLGRWSLPAWSAWSTTARCACRARWRCCSLPSRNYPQRDAMQTPADLCSDAADSNFRQSR